jgi:hypothetical protein
MTLAAGVENGGVVGTLFVKISKIYILGHSRIH